jgi:hypothetical protein
MTQPGTTRAAGAFSLAAGFIHAVAAGTHVEHKIAALSMATLAAGQCASGLALLTSRSEAWRRALIVINLSAIAGWLTTRTVGIGFIEGYDSAESIQTADTLCALLAILAVIAITPRVDLSRVGLTGTIAPIVAAILAVPAVYATANHQHDHGAAEWPRPYFPSIGIDIADVPGVSVEQEKRARQLVIDTQRVGPITTWLLPKVGARSVMKRPDTNTSSTSSILTMGTCSTAPNQSRLCTRCMATRKFSFRLCTWPKANQN